MSATRKGAYKRAADTDAEGEPPARKNTTNQPSATVPAAATTPATKFATSIGSHTSVAALPVGSRLVLIREDVRAFFYPRPQDVDARERRDLFLLAIAAMKKMPSSDESSLNQMAGIHGLPVGDGTPGYDGDADTKEKVYCTHRVPAFTTWHRPYLALMELKVQDAATKVAQSDTIPEERRSAAQKQALRLRIPYWDWARPIGAADNPDAVPDIFRESRVKLNSFGLSQSIENPLFNFAVDPKFMSTPPTQSFTTTRGSEYEKTLNEHNTDKMDAVHDALSTAIFDSNGERDDTASYLLEQVHNSLHVDVGNWMGDPQYSAFDPIFWFHHAFVDYLVAAYQTIFPEQYLTRKHASDRLLTPFHKRLYPTLNSSSVDTFTSAEVRKWTDFAYTYADLLDRPLTNSIDATNVMQGNPRTISDKLLGRYTSKVTDHVQTTLLKAMATIQAPHPDTTGSIRASSLNSGVRETSRIAAAVVVPAAASESAASSDDAESHMDLISNVSHALTTKRWFLSFTSLPCFYQKVGLSYVIEVSIRNHPAGTATVFSGFQLSDCDTCNNNRTTSARVNITAAVMAAGLTHATNEDINEAIQMKARWNELLTLSAASKETILLRIAAPKVESKDEPSPVSLLGQRLAAIKETLRANARVSASSASSSAATVGEQIRDSSLIFDRSRLLQALHSSRDAIDSL